MGSNFVCRLSRGPTPRLGPLSSELGKTAGCRLLITHGRLVGGVPAKCHEFGERGAVPGSFGESAVPEVVEA